MGCTAPIDDMGPHNAPSHADLQNRLAEEFCEVISLKQLLRWIVSCDAYHLTTAAPPKTMPTTPPSATSRSSAITI